MSTQDVISYVLLNRFRVAMIEGPRGVGKTTLIKELASTGKFQVYKTWGSGQKEVRFRLEGLGLDITQGTYFVLDFLKQVSPDKPVIADRGNLSALVYQADRYPRSLISLYQYYVQLMRDCHAILLVLYANPSLIAQRRIAREEDDEQLLHTYDSAAARWAAARDCERYFSAAAVMEQAGLELVFDTSLGGGVRCEGLAPRDLHLPYADMEDEDDGAERPSRTGSYGTLDLFDDEPD